MIVPVFDVALPLRSLLVGLPTREVLGPGEAVPRDLDGELARERVHHGNAHAMKAAGHRVGLVVELATGVQRGQHDLDRGPPVFGSRDGRDGDAAAVVHDLARPVGQQPDEDLGADAGKRLVDRVVHDLVDEVVQTPRTGASDVHAGPAADCLEALQDGDVGRRVVGFRGFARQRLPPSARARARRIGPAHAGPQQGESADVRRHQNRRIFYQFSAPPDSSFRPVWRPTTTRTEVTRSSPRRRFAAATISSARNRT